EMGSVLGNLGFNQRVVHEFQPSLLGGLVDAEWHVAHAQAWMTALIDVGLWPAEAEDQKVAQSLFCRRHIEVCVHGAENVVIGDLSVESRHQAREAILADHFVDRVGWETTIGGNRDWMHDGTLEGSGWVRCFAIAKTSTP